MILPISLAIACLGATALVLGIKARRPGLILLASAILASHAWPLFDSAQPSATLVTQFDTVAIVALLASASWLLGYWLCSPLVPADVAPILPIDPAPIHFHRLVLALLCGLLLAAPGGIVGFAQTGFLRLPVDSLLFSITYATACLAALTTTLLAVTSAVSRTRPPFVSMAFVLLVFWLLGGRTQLAISAISFALVYLAHGRIRLRRLVLPTLAITVMATLTLTFRLTLQGESTGFLGALRLMVSQISLLESYALCARFVEEFGTHAAHYLETLQQIIPRAIFPDKPPQLSRALRLMEARDTLGGLTPGLAGEAFVAAGFFGVVIVGLVFGGALALLDNCYLRLATLRPLAQALTVCLLPLLAIFVLRGGLDTAIFRLVILLVAGLVSLAWFWPLKANRRPAA